MKVLVRMPGKAPAGVALLVDGYAEKSALDIQGDLISVTLHNLTSGVHELALLFFNENTEITSRVETRFFVRLPEPEKIGHKNDYRQFGRVVTKADWKGGDAQSRIVSQSELKMSKTGSGADTIVAGKKETPLSQQMEGLAEAAYNVKYKQLQAYAKVLFSTNENRFRQPAHRITGSVKYGPWAAIKAGDIYPSYNELVLTGTRVR